MHEKHEFSWLALELYHCDWDKIWKIRGTKRKAKLVATICCIVRPGSPDPKWTQAQILHEL